MRVANAELLTLILAVVLIVPVTASAARNSNHEVTVIDAGSGQSVSVGRSELGKRIGSGDRIKVYLESGPEIEIAVIEVSVIQPRQVVDLSGTYTSELSGKTGRLDAKRENPVVRLTQDGNRIEGTFGKYGEIEGTVEDNRVTFEWYSSWTMGKGEWTVVEFDGWRRLVGSWESTHYPGGGDWNLTSTSDGRAGAGDGSTVIIGRHIPDSVRLEIDFTDIEKIELLEPLTTAESGTGGASETADDGSCRISEAARTAIDRALQAAMREDRINPDALDLVDQAEAAAGPPECNNDKAIELAEEARRLAERGEIIISDSEDADPWAEATDTPKARKPVKRLQCDFDPGGDLRGVGPGSDPLGILVSFTMTTAYTFVVASCYSSQSSTDSTNRRNSEYAEIRQQLFVGSVADRLGGDAARGAGEYLEAMAYLQGCPAETHAEFARLAQLNFTRLFPDYDVDSETILHNIRQMIAADPLLASSCRFAS